MREGSRHVLEFNMRCDFRLAGARASAAHVCESASCARHHGDGALWRRGGARAHIKRAARILQVLKISKHAIESFCSAALPRRAVNEAV